MCVASELKKVMDSAPEFRVLAHLGRWFKGDTLEAEKLIAPYTRYVHVDLGMAEGVFSNTASPIWTQALTDIGALITLARRNSYACAEYRLAAISVCYR